MTLSARAELGQVEGVGRAGIDDELHHAGRLLLRELRAVRAGVTSSFAPTRMSVGMSSAAPATLAHGG